MPVPDSTKVIVLQNYATAAGLDLSKGPSGTFAVGTHSLPPLQDGEILVQVIFMSNDAGPRSTSFDCHLKYRGN
jgi:NADPH-dependent curcumin reductase CurA